MELPDERWQPFDPLRAVADVTSQWTSVPHDWTNVSALWLGLEDDGSRRFVDPVAFSDLDGNNFPNSRRMAGRTMALGGAHRVREVCVRQR